MTEVEKAGMTERKQYKLYKVQKRSTRFEEGLPKQEERFNRETEGERRRD